MQRNTLTTINHLRVGDRFYKAGDKKQTVFEKVHLTEFKKTPWQTYSHFAIEVKYLGRVMTADNIQRFAKAFKSDTEVVFLRNINEKTN